LKWEADQRDGFFGWEAGESGQPLHWARVDVREALGESREVLEMWRETQKHPDAQPFTGGMLDAWPAWAADGLAIARIEVQRIRSYLQEARR